ncbi:MAG: PAS domain S-box protein [Thermodesulfovibrionales bacterium]
MDMYTGFKKTIGNNRFILAGIGLGALFLILEAGFHVLVLHRGSFIEEILKNPHEVALRLLITALFIALGVYAQFAIKKRKRLEELVFENECSLQSILESMRTGVLVIDAETHTITYANSFAAEMVGADKNDIIGRVCHRFVCPAELNKCPITDMGQTIDVSERALLSNTGKKIPILKSVREVDYKGKRYLIENFISIEERKLAEDALRNSEKKLRDITSSLGEGIYVMNEKGSIIFMNPEAERLLGWTHEELMDKNVHDIVHGKRADGTPLSFDDCPMHSVLKTGIKYFSYKDVFIRKDGTVFPVSVISAPIIEDDKVVASVTAFSDITERKKIEKEREELINELQDALAKVKQLSGMLPICASCKKIRDDKGYWNQIEVYIRDHSEAEFTHGLCPECAKKAYKELDELKEAQKKRNKE